jgi:hypothetical protein
MPTKRSGPPPETPLSPELRTLLLEGPWACGLTLETMPSHEELTALWRVHGPAILATWTRGQHIWWLERDWVVRSTRGGW